MANLERIRELVLILEKIPSNQFSLESWLRGLSYPELKEFLYKEKNFIHKEKFLETEFLDIEKAIKYGTVACAIGWALLHKPFSDLGFRFKMIRHFYKGNPVVFLTLVYKENESWDAVNAFFDLSLDESFYLFDSNSYIGNPGLYDVLSRLKSFLEEKKICFQLDN